MVHFPASYVLTSLECNENKHVCIYIYKYMYDICDARNLLQKGHPLTCQRPLLPKVRVPDFYEITIYISQTPRWNSGNPNIGRDPSVFGWTFYLLLKSSLFEPRKFDPSFPKLITSHSGHPKVAFWGVFLPISLAETSSNEEISGTGMTQGAQPPKKVIPPKVEQLAPAKCWDWKTFDPFRN